MFDHRLRDKLLFEDLTYSRRYFWAYNTLSVVNDGISSMIAAYTDTFTNEFWQGRHPTLFPFPDGGSPELFHLYLDRLRPLRIDLEKSISELKDVREKNENTRREIVALRDQLFSGSSVKESRKAIEQGDNIKVLTSISLIFLPLMFVTSVFGMTEFSIRANSWEFAVTMSFVCIPFLILLIMLRSRGFVEWLQCTATSVRSLLSSIYTKGTEAREEAKLQSTGSDTAKSIDMSDKSTAETVRPPGNRCLTRKKTTESVSQKTDTKWFWFLSGPRSERKGTTV